MSTSLPLTKSQVNRLGDRLRKGHASEEDSKLLDQYRDSFRDAYEAVVGRITDELRLDPTGRAAKTTKAIIEKLRREKTRLTQMQDIAGCRVITKTLLDQDRIVAQLQQMFDSEVVDRRYRPSHGYRAVHVIVKQFEKLVEIQVRYNILGRSVQKSCRTSLVMQ
jgi:GTP pyrophosphokinase